ncbi:anti-anti-sigma regulatory factor [Streptomyces sp. LBL]|uniref:STAS domain-containing protein n=1 Tax=Streptomyces sp. LBL TaxID=2940562 RepID=UPI0024746CD2|nr:STAS domain-containing protein [Streptomyces sp. LBL]MDH6629526.1 anti-anti-sigma regulatory factor [Streptomyces sp. LBL]
MTRGAHVTLCRDATAALLTVDTDIDGESRRRLESAVDDLPATVRELTLDLGHVVFADSAVLYLIHGMQRAADHNGGRLWVAGLTGQPRTVLRHAAQLWPEAHWDSYLRAS